MQIKKFEDISIYEALEEFRTVMAYNGIDVGEIGLRGDGHNRYNLITLNGKTRISLSSSKQSILESIKNLYSVHPGHGIEINKVSYERIYSWKQILNIIKNKIKG